MREEDRPLKIREVADQLGVEYGTIRSAIEQGLLPAIRRGESFRVLPADLIAYRERIAGGRGPKVEPPAPEPPASGELQEAREFAERARRWVRRPAVVRPRPKGEGGTGAG